VGIVALFQRLATGGRAAEGDAADAAASIVLPIVGTFFAAFSISVDGDSHHAGPGSTRVAGRSQQEIRNCFLMW